MLSNAISQCYLWVCMFNLCKEGFRAKIVIFLAESRCMIVLSIKNHYITLSSIT